MTPPPSVQNTALLVKEERTTDYPITFSMGVIPLQIFSLVQDEKVVARRWYKAWRMIFENSAEFESELMPAKGGAYSWLREPVKFRCSGGSVVLGMDPYDVADPWNSYNEVGEEEWSLALFGKSKNYDELFVCIARAVEETLKIKISWCITLNSYSQELELIPVKTE